MRVLIACEESQRVCFEFRERGHEAYSADILEPSGGHPEWHILGDVLPLLNGNCTFRTMDGEEHEVDGKWDMIIAFPPCTHLSLSGARHFEKKRADGRQAEGIELFCQFFLADCDRVAIENPMNIIKGGKYILTHFPELAEKYRLPRKESQIIQPYYFGDPFEKTTCLWLKGLPNLQPTNMVEPPPRWKAASSGKTLPAWYNSATSRGDVDASRQSVRSKTFTGIARAMADQWGNISELF